MAQKRMLNKSISLSKQINDLNLKEKLLFTWSIPHLDDYGLLDSSPEVIKATVVPMVRQISILNITSWIDRCVELKLIKKYEDCIEFLGFENHQSISQEKKAKCKFAKIPQENIGENNKSIKKPIISKDKIREDKIREDNKTTALAVAENKDVDKNSEQYLNSLNDVGFVMELFRRAFGVSPKAVKNEKGQDLNIFSIKRLVRAHTRQKLRKMLEFTFLYQKTDKFCKICVNPLDFEKNYSWYKAYFERKNIELNKVRVEKLT